MSAWTQLMEPGPALLFLVVILAPHLIQAAPYDGDQSTEIEYYPVADSTGCYYNFEHYNGGDRIITNEPCLNCTCHNRMLMCYLRVCPFTKAIGQDCKVEKKPDQCCPVITCSEVPVRLVPQSSTEPSTALGHLNEYGCSIDNLFYADGAKVPSNPDNACEVCYCIRNKTACIIQECTLTGKVVEGCRPVYLDGVCCPLRYDCDHPQIETTPRPLLTTTTTTTTTTTIAPTTMRPKDCIFNNELYADGALVKKDLPCEKCYCMRGDIICAVQECGPTPLDKVNCTALPIKPGQCCPDTYDCGDVSDEDLTTLSYYEAPTTLPTVIFSSPAEETKEATETPSPQKEQSDIDDNVTEETISKKDQTTESVTEAITSRITGAVTDIMEAITSTVFGTTPKSVEEPEIVTEGSKESETQTPIDHHTESQTVGPPRHDEPTSTEILEVEGEPIVHDEHKQPEDNEIPNIEEKPEATTQPAQVSDEAHVKPEDNEIDQHHETIKPSDTTTPDEIEQTEVPEVITKASVEDTHSSETAGETKPTSAQEAVTQSSTDDQNEVPTEGPIVPSHKPEITSEITIPTTGQVEAGVEVTQPSTEPSYEASSERTHAPVSTEKEVAGEATEPTHEKPKTPVGVTEVPEYTTSETSDIDHETVQPNEGQDEIITETSEHEKVPEDESGTEPTKEGEPKPDENQTSRPGEGVSITPTEVPDRVQEGETQPGVTESRPSTDDQVGITEVPEKEVEQSSERQKVTEPAVPEKPEEIEIVTSIPNKETEKPQSMDHVLETTLGTESPAIQKEGEPAAVTEGIEIAQRPHEVPTEGTEENDIPAVVEECTKEGCTKLEHTPAGDDVTKGCTKEEGCTNEGEIPDETHKDEQPEQEATESSDIPKEATFDCVDEEDCVPEGGHVPESTGTSESGTSDSEQEPSIPSTSESIVEYGQTTEKAHVPEHEIPSSSLPEGIQVTEEIHEQTTEIPKEKIDGEPGNTQPSTPGIVTENDLLVTSPDSQDTSPTFTEYPVKPESGPTETTKRPVIAETTSESMSPSMHVTPSEVEISSKSDSTELPESSSSGVSVEVGSTPAYITLSEENITEYPNTKSEHVTLGKVESELELTEPSETIPEHVTSSEGSGESGITGSTELPVYKPEHVSPSEGSGEPGSTDIPESEPEHVSTHEIETTDEHTSTKPHESKPEYVTPSEGSGESETTEHPVHIPEQVTPSEGSGESGSTEFPSEGKPEHVTSHEEGSSKEPEITESPESRPEHVTPIEGSGQTETTETTKSSETRPEHITPSEGSGDIESPELPESASDRVTLPDVETGGEPKATESPESRPEHVSPSESSGVPISTELPETKPDYVTPTEGSGGLEFTEHPETKPSHDISQGTESTGEPQSPEYPDSKLEKVTPTKESSEPESTEHPEIEPGHVTLHGVESTVELESTEAPGSKPEHVTQSSSETEGSKTRPETQTPEKVESGSEPQITELPQGHPSEQETTEGQHTESDLHEKPSAHTETPEGPAVKHPQVEEITTARIPSESYTEQHTQTPDSIPEVEQKITIAPSTGDEEHEETSTLSEHHEEDKGDTADEGHEESTTPHKYHDEDKETVGTEPSAVKTPDVSATEIESSTPVSKATEETQAPEMVQPLSTPTESEVPTTTEEERGVPGEGNCLVDGQTYTNNSQVPPINQCQVSCKCVSSILQCESIPCPGPPSNMQDCMPIFQSPGSCCPTYTCTGSGVTNTMESDSHVIETTTATVEKEYPVTYAPLAEATTQDHEKTPVHKEDVTEVISTVQEGESTTQKIIPQEETKESQANEESAPTQTTSIPETSEVTEHGVEAQGNGISDEPLEETPITPEQCGEAGCTIPIPIESHVPVTVEETLPTTTSSSEEEKLERGTQQPAKEYPEIPEKHCGPEGCATKEEPQIVPESCGSEGCTRPSSKEPVVAPSQPEEPSTTSPKFSEEDHCGPDGCVSIQEPVESATKTSVPEEEEQKPTQIPVEKYPEPTEHCGPGGCENKSQIPSEECGPDGCVPTKPQETDQSAPTTAPSIEGDQVKVTEEPIGGASVTVPKEPAMTGHGEGFTKDVSINTEGTVSAEQTDTTEKITTKQAEKQSTEESATEEQTLPEKQSTATTFESRPIGEEQTESSITTIPEHGQLPEEDKTEPSKETSAGEPSLTTASTISEATRIPEEKVTDVPEVITEIIPREGEHSTEKISDEDKKMPEVTERPQLPIEIEEQKTSRPETPPEHSEPATEKSPEENIIPTEEQPTEITEPTTASPAEIIIEHDIMTGKPIESAEHVTEQAEQEPSTEKSHVENEPTESVTPQLPSKQDMEPNVPSKEHSDMETTTSSQISKVTEPTSSVSVTKEGVTESEVPEPDFPTHPSEVTSPKSTDVSVEAEVTTTRRQDITEPQQGVEDGTTPAHVPVQESTETQTKQGEMNTEAIIPGFTDYSTESQPGTGEKLGSEGTKDGTTESRPGTETSSETSPKKHIAPTTPSFTVITELPEKEETKPEGVTTGEEEQHVTEGQVVTEKQDTFVTEGHTRPEEEVSGTVVEEHVTEGQVVTEKQDTFVTDGHTRPEEEVSGTVVEEHVTEGQVVTEKQDTFVTEGHTRPEEEVSETVVEEHVTEGQIRPEEIVTEKEPSAEDITQHSGEETTKAQPVTEPGKPQPTTVGTEEYATKHPQQEVVTEVTTATEATPVEVITKKITDIPESITDIQPTDEGIKTHVEPELEHGDITTEAQQSVEKDISGVPTASQGITEKLPESVMTTSKDGISESQPTDHPDVEVTESQPEEVEISTERRPEVDQEIPKGSKPEGGETGAQPEEGITGTQPGVTTTVTGTKGEITTQIPSKVDDRLKPEGEETTGPSNEVYSSPTSASRNDTELYTSGPTEGHSTRKTIDGELSTSSPFSSTPQPVLATTESSHEISPEDDLMTEQPDYPSPTGGDYGSLGPGTCRYGGKVFVSAQQIPRDDPCDFCFCFRSDIICLQQSCPPPIPNCHEEPIRGFCCPRYECPVGMATALNVTTTTTTTTTTLPPHFLAHAYKGRARKTGCQIQGQAYRVGDYIRSASGPCMHCTCGGDGQMKCDPKQCSPEPMLRQMIAAASRRRR